MSRHIFFLRNRQTLFNISDVNISKIELEYAIGYAKNACPWFRTLRVTWNARNLTIEKNSEKCASTHVSRAFDDYIKRAPANSRHFARHHHRPPYATWHSSYGSKHGSAVSEHEFSRTPSALPLPTTKKHSVRVALGIVSPQWGIRPPRDSPASPSWVSRVACPSLPAF